MTQIKKCGYCGKGTNEVKIGWTMDTYCSYICELTAVSQLHASMPGAGPVPSRNWVPHHVGVEISRRWEDDTD